MTGPFWRYLVTPMVVMICLGMLPAPVAAQAVVAGTTGPGTVAAPAAATAPSLPPAAAESPYARRNRLAAEAQVAQVVAEAARTAQENAARERLMARRALVDANALVAELAAMEQEEAKATEPQAQAFMAANGAEIERFVAIRLEEIRQVAGFGGRSEAEVRAQVLRELSTTVNHGIRAGSRLVRASRAALPVIDKEARAAATEADATLTAVPTLDAEAAYQRLLAADRQLAAELLKVEALQRSNAELGPQMAALRDRQGKLRQTLRSYRSQRQEQARDRERAARDLLASGDTAAAVEQLKESARLDPASHPIVSQIVALQWKQGQAGSRIYANGQPLAVEPLVVESRTLVPLRAVAEALGATVAWNGETRTVTFARGNFDVQLTIDSKEVSVNGRTVLIDVPARIYDSRTHVPLRAVAEMLNAQVTYDNETRAITVVDPEPIAAR